MKIRIRNMSKTNLTNILKQHTIVADPKEIANEIEQIVYEKHSAVD